ncbi:hypothetical protein fh0823_27910 (plasmid) [Francisella halioticida]|uniref:phage integrase N-terminal domain-containing protein n=1 Tax=Francisella halioticida TaxID=549298 RepID=UPI001AFB45E2|nr:phage integrase N-terminal domain-containing protein [Francisella halioticida]BCD92654.1 hypothetical protein fh0823_27910 [Francisella halioticida]
MDILKHKLLNEVYNVIDNTTVGSYNFKKVRKNFLKRLVKDILDLKLDLKSFFLFNNEHLHKLVAYWHAQNNSVSTIRNKRSMIVWFLETLGSSVVLDTAKELDLKRLKQSKDFVYLSEDIIHKVHHPLTRTILDFQMYFGLTKLESIKINLNESLRDNELRISKKLAFNSNERFINIVSSNQKQAIESRIAFLQTNLSLLDLLPLRDIISFYDCELLLNNIPKKADLRKFFIQKNYINFQNKGFNKADTYEYLMKVTGFKTKNNLIRLAFS